MKRGERRPADLKLKAALESYVASPNTRSRENLLGLLANSTLIFLAEEPKSGDTKVRLAFTREAEAVVLPAFTDDVALLRWAPTGGHTFVADARGFVPAVLAGPFEGLSINPGSSSSVTIHRQELESLAGKPDRA